MAVGENRYNKLIRQLYLDVIKEVVKLTKNISLNANNEFYFRNYSSINEKVNKLIIELNKNVYSFTVAGIDENWEFINDKYNKLAYTIYGKSFDKLSNRTKKKYLSTNDKARQAFINRKYKGLDLSDRVWRNTRQFKKELELAIEYAISEGTPAATTARQITRYLNEPDRLYRRVRDSKGELRLSKAAKAYNPGRGVYRSSYKNALRLMRNEVNNAYEEAQREKRMQQDFIVGVEIRVSQDHNPLDDKGGISCLALQGKYPKDFKWVGKWHVQCLCQSYNIIKSHEELEADTELILRGQEPTTKSKNEVKNIPNSFTNYVNDNKSKWEKWGTQPMFLDNIKK